jgi:hypothetical protein
MASWHTVHKRSVYQLHCTCSYCTNCRCKRTIALNDVNGDTTQKAFVFLRQTLLFLRRIYILRRAISFNVEASWNFSLHYAIRLRLKYGGTRAETRFRLSAKRTSPFKSAGASVQSTIGSRGVRISGSNAGYTMFRGSVKSTGYPLHSRFPFTSPPVRRRMPSHFNWTLLWRRLVNFYKWKSYWSVQFTTLAVCSIYLGVSLYIVLVHSACTVRNFLLSEDGVKIVFVCHEENVTKNVNPFLSLGATFYSVCTFSRLCGLVVRVSGYRYRGPGFDYRRYQIFWVVLGLERGPLSLVRSIEELLE